MRKYNLKNIKKNEKILNKFNLSYQANCSLDNKNQNYCQ